MDKKELTQNHDRSLYLEGRRLAFKSASVGCIVFGLMYSVILSFAPPPPDTSAAVVVIVVSIILTLSAIALAYFPASFMGGRLANLLGKDADKHALSGKSAFVKGMLFGAIAGALTCLPILFPCALLDLLTGHGDFSGMLFQAGIVVVIASIAGGWTGKQLERFIIKSKAA